MDSVSSSFASATVSRNKSLLAVSKSNPCPHCGKPDWCYSVGELSVCNRDQPPAEGWEETSKTDRDGHKFYAPKQEKKPIRPAQTRYFKYRDWDGLPLVMVERIDDGKGKKKIWQEHWDGKQWVKGLENVERCNVPPYRYAEVTKAIANSDYIFIVDGEQCADALWALGLAATTSIGGMSKWRDSDTQFLEGAKAVIVPDRDKPGAEDADKLSKHFPEAQWLFVYPESKAWHNLPKSGGLDVYDWIESHKLKASDILDAIMTDKNEIETFRAILMKARPLETESLDTGDRKKAEHPSSDAMAREIAEDYRDKLKFNNTNLCWYRYEADSPGVWSPETDEYIESVVYQIVKSKGLRDLPPVYVGATVRFLRHELIERQWKSRTDLIPFANGALETATGKLLPHSPGYRFTWSLPRDRCAVASD